MPILKLKFGLFLLETPTPSFHLKECRCKRLSLSEFVGYGLYANSFNLLWPKMFFMRVCICNTIMHFILGLLLMFLSFYLIKKNIWKKKMRFLYYTSSRCVIKVGLWNLHFTTVYLVLLWWALFFCTLLVYAM